MFLRSVVNSTEPPYGLDHRTQSRSGEAGGATGKRRSRSKEPYRQSPSASRGARCAKRGNARYRGRAGTEVERVIGAKEADKATLACAPTGMVSSMMPWIKPAFFACYGLRVVPACIVSRTLSDVGAVAVSNLTGLQIRHRPWSSRQPAGVGHHHDFAFDGAAELTSFLVFRDDLKYPTLVVGIKRRRRLQMALVRNLGIMEWTAIALAIGITLVPLVPYGA